LKNILFRYLCQFSAKSGVIDLLRLGDPLVDRDRPFGHPCFTQGSQKATK